MHAVFWGAAGVGPGSGAGAGGSGGPAGVGETAWFWVEAATSRPDGQVIEEADDLGLAHLERMALAVEEDEPSDSLDISVLRADAIMQSPGCFPDLVSLHGP